MKSEKKEERERDKLSHYLNQRLKINCTIFFVV